MQPISLAERNGPPPKERPRGNPFGWVSPWTPFLNDQKEGAAAPSFGIHPRRSGSGAESRALRQAPRNLCRRNNLRHERGLKSALQRTRMKPVKSAKSWRSTVRIPQNAGQHFGTKAFFFWTVHGPFSFSRKKKMGGAFAHAASLRRQKGPALSGRPSCAASKKSAYSSGLTRAMCSSSSCAWVISQNGRSHFGSPDTIQMLGGNEFRLRQGFA